MSKNHSITKQYEVLHCLPLNREGTPLGFRIQRRYCRIKTLGHREKNGIVARFHALVQNPLRRSWILKLNHFRHSRICAAVVKRFRTSASPSGIWRVSQHFDFGINWGERRRREERSREKIEKEESIQLERDFQSVLCDNYSFHVSI